MDLIYPASVDKILIEVTGLRTYTIARRRITELSTILSQSVQSFHAPYELL